MLTLEIEVPGLKVVREFVGNPNGTQVMWLVDGMLSKLRQGGCLVTSNSPAQAIPMISSDPKVEHQWVEEAGGKAAALFRVQAPMGPIPMKASLTSN